MIVGPTACGDPFGADRTRVASRPASSAGSQSADLVGRQQPRPPLFERPEFEFPDRDPNEAQRRDVVRREKAADVPVASLVEHDPKPGVALAMAQEFDRARGQGLAAILHGQAQAGQKIVVRNGVDLHVVGLVRRVLAVEDGVVCTDEDCDLPLCCGTTTQVATRG